MNKIKPITVILLVYCMAITNGFAQSGPGFTQHIVQQLNKFAIAFPVEKAYLQFDKPYYSAGDDIWFKAYVTASSNHWLSNISGLLYAELINDNNTIIQSIKLPLANGLADGSFVLPDTLTEGNYRIRAYTTWMRNAGEGYFFDKVITILNTNINKVFTTANYTYTAKYGYQQVSADINYADMNGIPYTGKEVDYRVQLGPTILVDAKGTTDDNGDLNFTFNPPSDNKNSTGRIITGILLKDKDTVYKTVLVKAVSNNVDVQFFPEGGEMVNGIETNVAFKAVGADGLGAEIKGTITDNLGNEANKITTKHLGMSEFTIFPVAGRTYKANIVFGDGSTRSIPLPQAIDKGYILNVDNHDPANVTFAIKASDAMHADHPADTLSLVGQADGHVYYVGTSKPGSMAFNATIAKSRFPTGIVQFTLFSSSAKDIPLNERLVFIQNHDQLKLNVNTEKQNYLAGEKVKINLAVSIHAADAITGASEKPVTGSFAVAVTNETKVPVDEANETTILSNLLLTADLRGYIEQPDYYFVNDDVDSRANLDLLMLTQGYRHFEWKKILDNNIPQAMFQREKAIQVSGHITTPGGQPLPEAKVSLIEVSGGHFYLDTVTDEQGKFTFNNLVIADSVNFMIEAHSKKDKKNLIINLDKVPSQEITINKNTPDLQVNINKGLSAYMQNSHALYEEQLKYGLGNHSIILKEVVVQAQHPSLKYSRNLNGPGVADQVLTDDKLTGCATVTQCLAGKLVGVIFRNDTAYSTRGTPSQTVGLVTPGSMMVFMVDGIEVTDATELNTINPNDIGVVEVLRTPAMYAIYGIRGGPGGVIVITTKRGFDQYEQRRAPNILAYTPHGFYRERVFYSPQYDDPKTNKSLANLRTTVYWNPNMITDKDGKASVEFFNAAKGNYRVVVEGIDNDGKIGRQVYHYKVN